MSAFWENTSPGFLDAVRRIVREELEAIETSRTGTIVSYDPETRSATVQPNGKTRYRDAETGEMVDEALPPITNVPVRFDGGGPWESVFDVVPNMQCELSFIKHSLEEVASTGIDGPSDPEAPPFQLSDCIAKVGMHHFAAAGVPCPKGVWRIGAKDGPQIIIDTITQTLSFRSVNVIELLAELRIIIDAPDSFINRRRVALHQGDL